MPSPIAICNRTIVQRLGRPNLANTTCVRHLTASVHLTEVAQLDGSIDQTPDEELEAFIAA
jgi:hypothetical protein